MPASAASAIDWSFSVTRKGCLWKRVHVAEGDPRRPRRRLELVGSLKLLDLEVAQQRSRIASCLSVSSFRPVSRRWVGKTSRPGSESEQSSIST